MPGPDQTPKSPLKDDEEGRKQAELLERLMRDIPVYDPGSFIKPERNGPEERRESP